MNNKKSLYKKMQLAVTPGTSLEQFLVISMDRYKTAFEFNVALNRIFRAYIVGNKWYFYSVSSKKFYLI